MEEEIFEIIVHSGAARGKIYEALDKARINDPQSEIDKLLAEAKNEMVLAHNIQTKLITDEMNGDTKITLLLIHAQDQFMTTMSEQSLIEQMIAMQQEINELKK